MKTEAEIRERLAEVESDPRLRDYKCAVVEINAPLALVQMGLAAVSDNLRWVLGEKKGSWPLKS